jgi:heat shock protein HslJ
MHAVSAALLAATMSACDETLTAPTPDDLSGAWQLLSLAPRNAPVLMPKPETPMGVEFSGDRISIRSDCNSCSGSFSASSGTFRLSPLACTLRACIAESLEGPYLQLLTTANTINVLPGRLLTLDGPNGTLSFRR